MPTIRLLTSVHGGPNEPVAGDFGDELDVDSEVADVWADGERAVLVEAAVPPTPVDLVKRVTPADAPVALVGPVAPVAPITSGPKRRQRRTRPANA